MLCMVSWETVMGLRSNRPSLTGGAAHAKIDFQRKFLRV
jgi:hypothetical protein